MSVSFIIFQTLLLFNYVFL